MKYIFFLLLFVVFVSCDYYGDYHYEVKNELNLQAMVLTQQDTFLIDSGEQMHILTTGSGNLVRNDDPLDIFVDKLTDLYVLKVYVNDSLIDKDFRQRNYWKFEMNGNRSSTYLLRISEDLVESKP